MDTGLTTLDEDDIAKHKATAQSFVSRFIVLESASSHSSTPIAGTGRRFVSTISSSPTRKTREVELTKTIQGVNNNDPLLSIPAHTLLFRTRRAISVALAVSELFAKSSALEALQSKNSRSPLEGSDAAQFHALLTSSAYVCAFAFASYLVQLIETSQEPANDVDEPEFIFDTSQDALKAMIGGLEQAISQAPDDQTMLARAKGFARVAIAGLLQRKARFEALGSFEDTHLRLESDDFTINGFDVEPGQKSKALVMNFKKPNEIIGNHIAKYQAIKLAKMLMAYDFDRQMNPFVDLGGFLFTFIGDGAPGTGKTILIQMTAGLINDYCQMAGYGFHYENFGVDQISSYQGKSGQNCKNFIDNVLNPRVIGFGTVDDIDQIAAKRSDDHASAGQHEITGVLMSAFAGATTVIRGNCSFGMFSNYPENVDDALRQRAGARWLVDGPQTLEDYVDIFALLAGKNHSIELGSHELFSTQQIKSAVATAYSHHDEPQEEGLKKIHHRFLNERGVPQTLADIGSYLYAIKRAEPRFTGRAIKNITDAIKMRAMDIELPDEWFETPDAFVAKSYDDKKSMIEELRGPFDIGMVMQEINRYADSEFRYSDRSDGVAVSNIIRDQRLRERALREIETLKREGRWNG